MSFGFLFLDPLTALGTATAIPLIGILGWFALVWLAAASLAHVSLGNSVGDNGRFILTSLPGDVVIIATLWRLYDAVRRVARWLRGIAP